jgi:hypothetical protein
MATDARPGWVRRTLQRAILIDHQLAPSDHRASIRADYSMCCAWHEEHSFLPSAEPLEVMWQRYPWHS